MKIVLECTVEMVHLNRYPSTSGGQCSKLVLTGISFLDTLYASFLLDIILVCVGEGKVRVLT